MIKKCLIIVTILSIIGCATPTNRYKTKKRAKNTLPKVKPVAIPGGDNLNWRFLALSQDRVSGYELNESSVRLDANNLVKYQTRQTIFISDKYNYNQQIKYIYNLSEWYLNCNQEEYKIISSSLYDYYGKLIKEYNFKNQNFSPINTNSIAHKEYQYICLGSNRNLGY